MTTYTGETNSLSIPVAVLRFPVKLKDEANGDGIRYPRLCLTTSKHDIIGGNHGLPLPCGVGGQALVRSGSGAQRLSRHNCYQISGPGARVKYQGRRAAGIVTSPQMESLNRLLRLERRREEHGLPPLRERRRW